MSKAAEPSRLYFLGAGFSQPAGIPIADQLLDAVLEEVSKYPTEGFAHLHRSLDE